MENDNENIKSTSVDSMSAEEWPESRCKDCGYIGPVGLDSRPPGIFRTATTLALGGILLGNHLLNKAHKKAGANALCCSKCKSRNIEKMKK